MESILHDNIVSNQTQNTTTQKVTVTAACTCQNPTQYSISYSSTSNTQTNKNNARKLTKAKKQITEQLNYYSIAQTQVTKQ
jgi:hypothetical protein